MTFVNSMPWMDRKPSICADQRKVLTDSDTAMVEENMVIRAQAEYVVRSIRPIVRRSERADVRSLHVGTGETL
jgi:hypothetical protein